MGIPGRIRLPGLPGGARVGKACLVGCGLEKPERGALLILRCYAKVLLSGVMVKITDRCELLYLTAIVFAFPPILAQQWLSPL